MFALHETTQRNLCRIAFAILCAVPTLYVVGWAAAVNTPQYATAQRSSWEEELLAKLGLRTTIGRVARPSRGVVLLQDVSFFAPESDTPLFQARVLEIRSYEDGWLITASQLEADADRLGEVWDQLHEAVMVRGEPSQPPIWLQCAELNLRGGNGEQTLSDVSLKYTQSSSGPETLVEFRLPERATDKPCQLAIRRVREKGRNVSSVDLRTNGAALPCRVLAGYLPLLDLLGDSCQFDGNVKLEHDGNSWSGSISNSEFFEVELQRLLSACSLHTLRTRAVVKLDSAAFRDGQLASIRGSVAAEQGVVDLHFLRALNREMHIAAPSELLASKNEKQSFSQLGFDFRLDVENGLYLQGTCPGPLQGAMIVGESNPLLLQPQRPHLTAVSLIRALAPQSDVQTPATQQTRTLINALPVPDITLAQPTRPHANLRLRSAD